MGETNIRTNPIDTVFEVRISNEFFNGLSGGEYIHTKTKYLPYDSMLLKPGFAIDIHAVNWPVRVSWNSSLFDNDIIGGSLIANTTAKAYESTAFKTGLRHTNQLTLRRQTESDGGYYTTPTADTVDMLHLTFAKVYKIEGDSGISGKKKTGYRLIFFDEFNDTIIDPLKWNISDYGDDIGDSCLGHNDILAAWRKSRKNPANVSLADTTLLLKMSKDEYYGCTYSGGELKTFSVVDANFQPIYFYPGTLVEIRAKLPFADGVGSVGWTYTCGGAWGKDSAGSGFGYRLIEYNEIDLWEHSGLLKHSNFVEHNYHWQIDDQNHCGLGQNQGWVGTGSHRDTEYKGLGGAYHYGQNFTRFQAYWDSTDVIWGLNGDLINEVFRLKAGQSVIIGKDTFSVGPAFHPMAFRFGLATNAVGDKPAIDSTSLPVYLKVDYVRVYRKEGYQLAAWANKPEFVCNVPAEQAHRGFELQYYPYVNYTWQSDSLDISLHYNRHFRAEIYPKPGIAGNRTYPVTIITDFTQTEEIDTFVYHVLVVNSPSKPGTVYTLPVGNSCYYSPGVQFQDGLGYVGYEWSKDGGQTWHRGYNQQVESITYNMAVDLYFPEDPYDVVVRRLNGCGISDTVAASGIMPSEPPAPNCMWKKPPVAPATKPHTPQNVEIILELFNLHGRLMWKGISQYTGTYAIAQTSRLPSGVYIGRIRDISSGGILETIKIPVLR